MSSSSNSTDHDRSVRRFLRSLALLLAIKQSSLFITTWFFIWGAGALVLRVWSSMPSRRLLWGAIGVPVGAAIALAFSRKQLPSHESVRALLDDRNNCGGLLMAGADAEIGAWRIKEITTPKLHWRKFRSLGLLGASLAFVIICLTTPVRFSTTSDFALNVRQNIEHLSAEIENLKNAQAIDKARAESLEKKLDQIEREASGEEPANTYEALDHLNDELKKIAKEDAEGSSERLNRLAKAQSLAEGLMAGRDQLDARTMTEAMRTLSKMAADSLRENESLTKNISPEMMNAIKSGSLKPEDLKDLSKALKESKSALDQKLSKLGQSRIINPVMTKGGERLDGRDSSSLASFLKENVKTMSVNEAILQWSLGKGSKGENGKGGGQDSASMTWTNGSNEKGAIFKEKTLASSSISGMKNSQFLGLSSNAPLVSTDGVVAHGALNGAASGGGSAYTQTILPMHRSAVKRYFERFQTK